MGSGGSKGFEGVGDLGMGRGRPKDRLHAHIHGIGLSHEWELGGGRRKEEVISGWRGVSIVDDQ